MGVDFWDKETWHKEFNTEADVLVMTAQILVNILTHGFFSYHNINLLIMDECHNATKKHPYVRVMEFLPVLEGPHIMGLTASIINEKYKKSADESSIKLFLDGRMKALEGILRSKCITCSDREATSLYATKPEEIVLPYSSRYSINDFDQVNLFIFQFKDSFSNSEESFGELTFCLFNNFNKINFNFLENYCAVFFFWMFDLSPMHILFMMVHVSYIL